MTKLPFIFGKSSDVVNFTDREEESARLEMNFKSLIKCYYFPKLIKVVKIPHLHSRLECGKA